MHPAQKQLISSLIEAEKNYRSAEHLFEVIYAQVQDPRVFIKVLELMNKSLIIAISASLKYEHLKNNIKLTKDPQKNLNIFFSKCIPKYGLNELYKACLLEVVDLEKRHKKSGYEFSKAGKAIILQDDLSMVELTHPKIKGLLESTKLCLDKVHKAIIS